MPMTELTFPLGRRIEKWRKRTGLTAAEVAQKAGLSRPVLSSVEAGSEELSAYTFHRLAFALGIDPAVLLTETPGADPMRSTARFRTKGADATLAAGDVRLLSLAAELGRVGASLCELLDDERWMRLPYESTPIEPPPWRQGYRLGEAARVNLLPREGPLVSVQGAFEGLGIHVAIVPFSTGDVEAASLREPGAMPVILLNERAERVSRPHTRRAILAHELCHLLHDATAEDHLVTAVTRATDLHVDVEMRANGFGPAFLAPPSWLDGEAWEPMALARELMGRWFFSLEGAAWHVRNVLRLPESAGPALKEQLLAESVRETRVAEGVPRSGGILGSQTTPLVTGLIGDLAQRAMDAGHISEGRAREIAALG